MVRKVIAEVILNSNAKQLNKIFDYQVPEHLTSKVKIGSRVLVPFSNRKVLEEGFVVNLKNSSEYKVKEISEIDEKEYINKKNVEMAKWMSKRYFCNISDCIKLMLPIGTTTKIIKNIETETTSRVLENRVKEKNANFVYLKKDIEEIEEQIENKKIKSDKQIRALRFLIENEGVLVSDLKIFADVTKNIINTLEKNGYIEIVEQQIERNPFIHKVVQSDKDLILTEEQENAYKKVGEAIEGHLYSEFLLFGVTGSRKNRSVFTINRKAFKRR